MKRIKTDALQTLSASHERTAFEILACKCELVDENKSVVERRLRAQREGVDWMKEFLESALRLGKLPANVDTEFAVTMMYGFIQGSLNTSMLKNTLPANEMAVQAKAARIAALAMELPARCRKAPDPAPDSTQETCNTRFNTPQNASGNSE